MSVFLIASCGGLPDVQDGQQPAGTKSAASRHNFDNAGDHVRGDDRGGAPHEVEPHEWLQWGTHQPGDDRGGHPEPRVPTLRDIRHNRQLTRVGSGKGHRDRMPSPRATLGAKCRNICNCSAGQICGTKSGVCEISGDTYQAPCCTWPGCNSGQTCTNPDATKAVCE